MSKPATNVARTFVWIAVAALIIVHQDFWFWDTYEPLVFGFMPIGLAYHVLISILAAVVWFLATKYCFPIDVGELETENTSSQKQDRAK